MTAALWWDRATHRWAVLRGGHAEGVPVYAVSFSERVDIVGRTQACRRGLDAVPYDCAQVPEAWVEAEEIRDVAQ